MIENLLIFFAFVLAFCVGYFLGVRDEKKIARHLSPYRDEFLKRHRAEFEKYLKETKLNKPFNPGCE